MIDNTFTYKKMNAQEQNKPFNAVSITVASSESIRSWSHGEIKNPETINYRSFKPEKGGLFCERIFGPSKDWECNCGKYKRIKHKGVICDRCGVEVTQSKVRRERMGHIDLAVPVSHIWFFKCMPSRLSLMLDMTARDLEKIIYYEDWVVTEAGDTPLEEGTTLNEFEYREAREDYGDSFDAEMGAVAIRTLLENMDLPVLKEKLEADLAGTKNKAIRKKLVKRLRLVESFVGSTNRPEWMILETLPVIPPDLRPLVPLEGGRFATSDLNDLYRRVINRNNRLKNLLQLRTPDVIIRNEKRMLQEAVDALLDNGRHGRAVTGAGNRPLKSLSEMLKGKQGRFRQNLLGKRVDYSGRSVIVVGPELKLGQCGLPKKMALGLFEPFIIRHLKGRGFTHTVRGAKKMIERGETAVWDILEEITTGHPIMLNRAPTLHRLSIQAFDPILIEGSAIRLHPLVCTAYNADFDGDQMAVHLPLSNAAQMETKLLMLAPNNIFSPSNGKPITSPTQDVTLGAYYLTEPPVNEDKMKSYTGAFEVFSALDIKAIEIHDAVKIPNPDFGNETPWGNSEDSHIITTAGRCIFNEVFSDEMGFFNKTAKKKETGILISDSYAVIGHERTIELLDAMKNLGYKYATIAGYSISVTDMISPTNKAGMLKEARKEIAKVTKQYDKGLLTEKERYNNVIQIWTKTSADVADELFGVLEDNLSSGHNTNPVFAMLDSGARGSKDQIRQLGGMRGLMAKPSGDIIEQPITANFREGLTVLEYFISSHGARKGLADTALKTADSGYMTRKLVDVGQDIICREDDCGTVQGVLVAPIMDGDEEIVTISERIAGRFLSEDIIHPDTDKVIMEANEFVTPALAKLVEASEVKAVTVRSAITCDVRRGCCVKCYGQNLATDKLAEYGDSLGIIAAQSIGEPGTQLTMRTFHTGGSASSEYKEPIIVARNAGKLKLDGVRTVVNEDGDTVVVNQNGFLVILGTRQKELDSFELEQGSILTQEDGDKITVGQQLAAWDPHNIPIISEKTGTIQFTDLLEDITFSKIIRGGAEEVTVLEHREDLHPSLDVLDEKGDVITTYQLPSGALIMVGDGDKVTIGKTVARIPRQASKTKDITGGLPRVSELFEARIPKDITVIAKINGRVEIGKIIRGKRQLIIHDLNSETTATHAVPLGKHLIVGDNDIVKKGQMLTAGSYLLQDILEVSGPYELQKHIVNEVQKVYRAQGVEINDKHIEIIVRQMLQKVIITEPGSSRYLTGELIDKYEFRAVNAEVIKTGGTPAEAEPTLQGITKASLSTDSFISSASFQDTTRILTEASTLGKTDTLIGFKENVITGHLIPAGTGTPYYQNLKLKYLGEEIEVEAKDNIPNYDNMSGIEALQAMMADARPEGEDEETDEIENIFEDLEKDLSSDED